ncbi:Uma2 family endonuclease [Candidatus Entotheonella palauensis]|uniref:Uma2 family endonuclease n=1 Tax=Candidatus Entotheonella palauensis TaxID=93172 RepID=UPI000B7CE884|nr:Uma2 family endonuclease [Candidatus Entotheonella palauensis]
MSCVRLHNIGWKTYDALVTDLADSAGIRLTYDRGTLEILDPGMPHSEPILLYKIRYDTYEQLTQDMLNQAAPRMAYHKGMLELMSPSSSHEDIKQLFVDIADAMAEVRDADIFPAGSTTFRKRGLPEGFEADASFYITSADAISRQRAIDLDVDPPPDLIVEVNLSSSSMSKFPTYAALGVPEVWRYRGGQVRIHLLAEGGAYSVSNRSAAFTDLTPDDLTQLIATGLGMRRRQWLRWLRAFAASR